MPHYCRHCERMLPNERFSGRGHRTHLCKECQRAPRAEVARADCDRLLGGLMSQKRISPGNMKTLATLSSASDAEVARCARLLTSVGAKYPRKRCRIERMRAEDPGLHEALVAEGFIDTDSESGHLYEEDDEVPF